LEIKFEVLGKTVLDDSHHSVGLLADEQFQVEVEVVLLDLGVASTRSLLVDDQLQVLQLQVGVVVYAVYNFLLPVLEVGIE
jgi:hypothetical protein